MLYGQESAARAAAQLVMLLCRDLERDLVFPGFFHPSRLPEIWRSQQQQRLSGHDSPLSRLILILVFSELTVPNPIACLSHAHPDGDGYSDDSDEEHRCNEERERKEASNVVAH